MKLMLLIEIRLHLKINTTPGLLNYHIAGSRVLGVYQAISKCDKNENSN